MLLRPKNLAVTAIMLVVLLVAAGATWIGATWFGATCAAAEIPVRTVDHAVVLQYHHFSSTTPRSTSVTPEEFVAHLDYLATAGFRVRPLPEIVDRLARGESVPDSCVALTVDDAYPSIYTEAWPLLQVRGWSLTVFICPGLIDQGGRAYLSWEQVRELAAAGVIFANHSLRHDHLVRRLPGESDDQWRARIRADLSTAQQRIEEELGQAPPLFAYPYGEYDQALAELVRELGWVAFGQHSGPIWTGADFTALPRFPVSGPYADLDGLKVKAATLPLPVLVEEPFDPVLPAEVSRPRLHLQLAPGDFDPERLACFVSNQGRAELIWIDRAAGRLEVQAREALPIGRSRYNITAPARHGGRFFWYSHPWLRMSGGEN